jgi:DNA (cytosine-5)-methyltransferase 1
MKFLSVCSGIEAASVAWKPLGWEPVGFSEIEKFPCAVLDHHYPDVPNYGSLLDWKDWIDDVPEFNVLAGGTPCQGFSVAGRRGGMEDPRSQLAFDFLGIAASRKPTWVFWENVPGVLSSNGGRDFGAFLGALGECGYGFAYRVLDAQYFGLAQRRKRVFVVGYLGDWRPPAAVLLEPESLRGDSPPSRETGEGTARDVANCIRSGGAGTERVGDTRGQDNVVAFKRAQVGKPYDRTDYSKNVAGTQSPYDHECVAHTLKGEGHDASEDGTGRGVPLVADVCGPLNNASGHAAGSLTNQDAYSGQAVPVAFTPANLRRRCDAEPSETTFGTLGAEKTGDAFPHVAASMAVRRLTPTECCRLQGFPDDYLDVHGYSSNNTGKYGGNHGVPDGPKYKALGNSWAVPVVRWIGERIARLDNDLSGTL